MVFSERSVLNTLLARLLFLLVLSLSLSLQLRKKIKWTTIWRPG